VLKILKTFGRSGLHPELQLSSQRSQLPVAGVEGACCPSPRTSSLLSTFSLGRQLKVLGTPLNIISYYTVWALECLLWTWGTKVYSAFHLYAVGKWVPATAGKAEAGMAHSDCWWTCGCAGKTVKSLENTCHTWALLRWWLTMKRRYIKCMDLYL